MKLDVDYKKLGYRVKAARESKNMTQEELAELTELSNNYISNIERSRSIPSVQTLMKICNVLQVTPDSILLDSIRTPVATSYIRDDIAKRLDKCSDKTIRLVLRFIELMIDEQDA